MLDKGNQNIHRAPYKGTELLLEQHFLFISCCPAFRILHKVVMLGQGLRDCCSFRFSSCCLFVFPFFLFLKVTSYFLQRVVYGQGWRSLSSCTPRHYHLQSVANSRMNTCQEKLAFSLTKQHVTAMQSNTKLEANFWTPYCMGLEAECGPHRKSQKQPELRFGHAGIEEGWTFLLRWAVPQNLEVQPLEKNKDGIPERLSPKAKFKIRDCIEDNELKSQRATAWQRWSRAVCR